MIGEAPHCPQRLAPVHAEGAKAVGLRQHHQRLLGQFAAARELREARIAIAAILYDGAGPGFAEAIDLAKTETQAEHAASIALQRVVPVAEVCVGLENLDAVLARVAHDLRRRIEAHGLGVQKGAAECRRIIAFDPG